LGASPLSVSLSSTRGSLLQLPLCVGVFCPGHSLTRLTHGSPIMAKTTRKLKKANHGRRPASAKARKAKRKKYRT